MQFDKNEYTKIFNEYIKDNKIVKSNQAYKINLFIGKSKNSLVIARGTPKKITDYKKELSKLIKEKKLENVKTDFRWIPKKDKVDYYKNQGIVILPYTLASYQSGITNNAITPDFCCYDKSSGFMENS
ncbi:MAG: hypothetical protein KAK00_05220 [Nanoarchaeota archaeon]|nr:hypothetical protein [Nanoarchaeota archaeon]